MLSLSKHAPLRTLPDLRHAPAGAPAARVVARETAFAESVRQVPAVRRRDAGDDAAGIFAVMHVVKLHRARADELDESAARRLRQALQIGRASCRARGCQYV